MFSIIDLFCGQGGAAMGMHQALADGGIDHRIIGVDIRPQRRYPFEFVQADAVYFPIPATADFIWASPPCQAYSQTHALHPDKLHPDLVAVTRAKLQAASKPFCIENVPGSPLHSSLILRGNMFGLPIKRDRCFELSFFCPQPDLRAMQGTALAGDFITLCGNGKGRRGGNNGSRWNADFLKGHVEYGVALWRKASGMPWADQKGIAQAVPPAYSKYIMAEFLRQYRQEVPYAHQG